MKLLRETKVQVGGCGCSARHRLKSPQWTGDKQVTHRAQLPTQMAGCSPSGWQACFI